MLLEPVDDELPGRAKALDRGRGLLAAAGFQGLQRDAVLVGRALHRRVEIRQIVGAAAAADSRTHSSRATASTPPDRLRK